MKILEKISSSHQEREIDTDVMQKIAPKFGMEWRRVFRHLGVSDNMIDNFYQPGESLQEVVFKLMEEWAKKSNEPTVKTLLEALVRAEKQEIIEQLLLSTLLS